ncbi:uncharacterized protein BDCG_02772 [Blastomyces dermatitidis ER-3]|uniref:Uncharacterized protein n=1 Tax=Ajellomyces dermatitidis (strain ER-3 / ATCC MYA-2586) TaxID=559297 RepID=A0ABX2VUM5_AJEDR|nr:uncharacterized protein BDCG_02772 [Blastomyces dermatitidis ER-3]OAT00423.1 hypothetical protein BDCG_02772 [Blastomyces dermatitidis ER-3]
MSSQRRQQSRSSSSQRSRSSRKDQPATITAAQFEALNISSPTPPPPIAVHRAPEYAPSDLSALDANLAVVVSQAQQNWPSFQMTATVDSSSTPQSFTGVPNSEIRYSGFSSRQEQYTTEHMNSTFHYNMPSHSSAFAQPSYHYAGPGHTHLPAYGIEPESASSLEFPTNFTHRNPPPQASIPSDGLINMPPPGGYHYSVPQSQVSSTRQYKDRISITLSEHHAPDQESRPSNSRDEYIQHGFTSHPATEPYSDLSTNMASLTPDYLNHPVPNVTGHAYPASPSLYEPLHPYQRQYSFSPIPDTGVPATSASADNFSTPYSVSPAPEDQVRIVNSRPKPQCWDHGCNGREFSTFSNLLRHQREKAGTATKSECPHCGTVFTRTTARNGHLAQGKCKAKREQQ